MPRKRVLRTVVGGSVKICAEIVIEAPPASPATPGAMRMPPAQSSIGDKILIQLDPRTDGVVDWNQASCIWLRYLTNKPNCPWSGQEACEAAGVLLSSTSPLRKFVSSWPSSPNLLLVHFFFPRDRPWELRIDAYAGQNASGSQYRVADFAARVLGVDDRGNLNTLVIGPGATETTLSAVPQTASRTTVSQPASQATIVTPPTPQEVSVWIADGTARLRAAGDNVAAALDRLQRAIAAKAALSGAVGRTQAALEQLVQVAATGR